MPNIITDITQGNLFVDAPELLVIYTGVENVAASNEQSVVELTNDTTVQHNTTYIIKGGVRLNLSLPEECFVGFSFHIIGYSVFGWKLLQNEDQQIMFSGSPNLTKPGAEGFVEGGESDCLDAICQVANVKFIITNPFTGSAELLDD